MTQVLSTGTVAPPAPRRPAPLGRRLGAGWSQRAPLLPALIFAILVTQIPFLVTLYLSTLGWNALRPGERSFVGLSNYGHVLTDSRLRHALFNTVTLTASAVIVSVLLGLGLAILLDRKFPGRGAVRTLLITPFLVMPMASALIWKYSIFDSTSGLLNRIVGGDVDWVSKYPMTAVVASLVWQWTPFMMLIVLAGLQGQSVNVLDAARVDGAGAIQTFWYVTLPYLRPYLELGALLGAIYLFNTFDSIFTITQGGPGAATTNLPYEIYLTTFRKFAYGESSAAGVLAVAGTMVVAYSILRIVTRLIRLEGR